MAKKTAAATEGNEPYILKSDVEPCPPSIEYRRLDRQITLRVEMFDNEGNDYGIPSEDSFYSILQTYFNSGTIESVEELKALEDCFLFGLTEIAKQRAKL